MDSATHCLDQLLDQLARFYQRQAESNARLYDDRRAPGQRAGDTVDEVAAALRRARDVAAQLAHHLDVATAAASHLGG